MYIEVAVIKVYSRRSVVSDLIRVNSGSRAAATVLGEVCIVLD